MNQGNAMNSTGATDIMDLIQIRNELFHYFTSL